MSILESILNESEIKFDEHGCLPFAILSSNKVKKLSPYNFSLSDFIKFFVFNDVRRKLFLSLNKFMSKIYLNEVEIVRMYIGGSFVTKKETPSDIDILICWRPNRSIKNKVELEEFITEKSLVFQDDYKTGRDGLQIHFCCLLGVGEVSVHLISKWILLNSYHTDSGKHRGIVCIYNNR